MKIIIGYPPLENSKGYATLGQNRQFQYFREPTYIYPVVPAMAATFLKNAGHEVIWLDAIAENISAEEFLGIIRREKPELIAFETKTPVVKQLWKVISAIKGLFPAGTAPKIVLYGDHVTALPEESFRHSLTDYVLTGGDYDFLLLNLCNTLSRHSMAQHEPGIYYRENEAIKNTGHFQLNHDLNSKFFIDRDLTRWTLYAYKNGNYKRTPGTYVMSGRDCWWGRCSFCSWPTLYPRFRTRSPGHVLDEIGMLIERYNTREIMDDTGCFPVGDWLRDFCDGAIKRRFNKKIYLDCNMRFGALSHTDFRLMKKANFRLLLFGLESANQKTLDRIEKNVLVEQIIKDCKNATCAGLFPHITVMFGYPWEDYADALKTFNLGRWLLKKGYAYTMQATVVIPYPGTKLFALCKEEGLLKGLEWEDYDMKQPVMKTPIPDEKIMQLVQGMYKISFQPEFLLRKVLSMRDMDDLGYSLRAAKKIFSHIFDFSHSKRTAPRDDGRNN